jgi:hypothetical protein
MKTWEKKLSYLLLEENRRDWGDHGKFPSQASTAEGIVSFPNQREVSGEG